MCNDALLARQCLFFFFKENNEHANSISTDNKNRDCYLKVSFATLVRFTPKNYNCVSIETSSALQTV